MTIGQKAIGQEFECPDSTLMRNVCIMGAHDAATGHGFAGFIGLFAGRYAATQSLTIPQQWEAGARAFDLRPAMKGKEVWIYHGPLRTRLRLEEALTLIGRLLHENPREAAVILLRREAPSEVWADSVAAVFRRVDLPMVRFSDSLRVGECRGKALVITRDAVPLDDIARITPWSHNALAQAMIDSTAVVTVQDVFDCTAPGRLELKGDLMLRAARVNGWRINFLSGYDRQRSAASNRRVSTLMLRLLRDSVPSPSGILLLDFVK